jgi:hypothetical protein
MFVFWDLATRLLCEEDERVIVDRPTLWLFSGGGGDDEIINCATMTRASETLPVFHRSK